jgi:hypothetical protein
VEDLCVLEDGLDGCDDVVPLSGPDDDGDMAAGRDAAVAQEHGQRADGAAADLDGERTGNQAG